MTNVKLNCTLCNKEFYTPLKRYNYLRKKFGHKNFYCSKSCFINDILIKPIKKICLFCNKEFDSTTSSESRKCCSRRCSSKYSHRFLDPNKISNTLKEYWKNKIRIKRKKVCGFCKKEFIPIRHEKCCSKECIRNKIVEGARKSVIKQKENRRSKNEIIFSNLCINNFDGVITNEPMFNGWDADIILTNEKVAVLWNGRWHYDKLKEKHSVKQVQNRDRIKINEIIKFGYIPYVIKDMGKENEIFVKNEFTKFCNFLLTDYKSSV